MPRTALESNNRVALRIRPADKSRIMRAAALENTDLTDFMLRNALRAADAIIDRAEHVILSERDSLRILEMLENPPAPNEKLLTAAHALPKES